MKKWWISLLMLWCLVLWGCGTPAASQAEKGQPKDTKALAASTGYAPDALHKAAYKGDLQLVEKILQTKPDPDARDSSGGTALHAAMFQKNIQIVEKLLAYGLDVNAIGPKNGYTPLHDAVWGNNPEAVKLLLARGANPNLKGKDGLTPLEKARQEGKTEIVKILEEKKP
jgi:ankyrin repeat protein